MYTSRKIKIINENSNTKEGFYCNICGYPYINKDDFASKLNHHCCYDCYLTFAESRKDLWKKGWRPKQEVIDNYIENRRKLYAKEK